MTTAIIVHRIPGRIRLRIPHKRGDSGYFSSLSEGLRAIAGVHASDANPRTGSLVVQFDGDADWLLQQVHEQIPDLVIENDSHIKNNGNISITSFRLVSGREITPMFLLGSALTAIGIVQTFRGKIAVPAITAFWYALEAFRRSGQARQ